MEPPHRSAPRERIRYQPWGRLTPPATDVRTVEEPVELAGAWRTGSVLPFGWGRSYGDVCLNSRGTLLSTERLQRVLAFDTETGVIRAQAGMLLSEILDLAVPRGWFLPVTPGTKHVTLGGAVANDVHGKNHHGAGTIGRHLTALELARSDGSRLVCSPTENPEWFRATVGGLGLTGLMVWCELRLIPLPGRGIAVESTRFGELSEFFQLSEGADRKYAYTVSWIDCLARGRSLGRGWMFGGNHADGEGQPNPRPRRPLSFFFEPPLSLMNSLSLKAFNLLYYRRPVPRARVVDFEPFFYPLDAIRDWNRLYGPRGFYQFQCVVPPGVGEEGIREVLAQTAKHGEGSFLAVLKQFGTLDSPGLLSFPRPGPTLALDFPNRGDRTLKLLRRLESAVMDAGGALYPAKDACMSPRTFALSYPRWPELESRRDPAFTSDFWLRVTAGLR